MAYIVRSKMKESVITFTFDAERDAKTAAKHIKECGAPGFMAKTTDGIHGKVVSKWDGCGWPRTKLTDCIQSGAYKDTKWAMYGTEEECRKQEAEVNAKITCWASPRAHVEHIVGELWRVVEVHPFTD